MQVSDLFVGIDGCKSGWFFIGISGDGSFEFGTLGSFEEIAGLCRRAKLILVDIPIGLLDGGTRERLCDTSARRAIAPRGSTVFPAPARAAIGKGSYVEGSEENFKRLGRRLSRQSWAIAPKIAEVDVFMRGYGGAGGIREMHPEVAFWALNHRKPLLSSKKRREGFEERLRVLTFHFAKAEACFNEARKSFTKKQVANDDILDAMAGAVTARYVDWLRTLPEQPELDDHDLPMEIVYADLACVFCDPGSERLLFENDMIRCLWDAYPVSPGHVLIVPKRHVETWFEATAEEKAAMIEAIERVKEIIELEHKPTAYNIGINSGRDAGQTVPHLHLHVIPRYRGDAEDPRGGIRNILPARARWWEQE